MKGPAGIETIVRGIRSTVVVWMFFAGLCSLWCEEQANAQIAAAGYDSDDSAPTDTGRNLAKIHVNSDLVVVPVTVIDGKGRVVNGLQKEHFALYEDKVEQEITHFASEDAPVSIGLVFDTSDSMRPKLQKAREAVAALLNNANPEDDFFLVQFNQRAELLVGATTRTEEIRRHVAMMQTGGSTALLDAVKVALNEARNAHHTRKAIIIVSDGEDNASRCTIHELKEAVREADVQIYAIGLVDSGAYSQGWPPQGLTGAALLQEISKQTGGRLFEVNRLKQLPEIASKIGAWLRNQYVLAYKPSTAGKNGRYRHIQIKVSRPDGFPRLHASWRLGYYAPAE